jgi:hypothetical protein
VLLAKYRRSEAVDGPNPVCVPLIPVPRTDGSLTRRSIAAAAAQKSQPDR